MSAVVPSASAALMLAPRSAARCRTRAHAGSLQGQEALQSSECSELSAARAAARSGASKKALMSQHLDVATVERAATHQSTCCKAMIISSLKLLSPKGLANAWLHTPYTFDAHCDDVALKDTSNARLTGLLFHFRLRGNCRPQHIPIVLTELEPKWLRTQREKQHVLEDMPTDWSRINTT